MHAMDSVEADIKYLAPGEEKPVYYASRGGSEAQLNLEGNFETHRVAIRNGRNEPGRDFSLDREGFTLLREQDDAVDLYDEASIRAGFLPQVESCIGRETGATRVVAFDFTLRSDSAGVRGDRNSREPSTVVHNDYTAKSGPQRVRDLFPPGEAEELLKQQFQIVNFWRTIQNPVKSSPLAVCDAQSVKKEELVDVVRVAKERTGELTMAYYNPAHRWYYFDAMQASEALLIKTFDSNPAAVAKNCIHTAFHFPGDNTGFQPRESIEVRNFVFFS